MAPPLTAGDVLGRYQLLMPIAKGGMGQVWAARLHGTRGFQKIVAIKTILPLDEDAGLLESMLFQEASLACLVRHPNVVETLDLGECPNAALYLVMEWVNGEPLDYVLRAAGALGGVPLPILTHLLVQGLRGLQAVHQARDARGELAGIVHRDVSLQNLLVTEDGRVKLIDFGVAKATQQMSRPTENGMVKGKFAYMSPEQLRGEALDARADIFAAGVCVYRATTGVHPFRSDNHAATLRRILSDEPPRPSELFPDYPKALEDVVLKALAKDRSARFESAHQMLVALEGAVPAAASPDCVKESEAFLRGLLAPRNAERMAALQDALKAADQGRQAPTSGRAPAAGEMPRWPRSQSTMRAVSRPSIPDPDAADPRRPSDARPSPLAPVRPGLSGATRWTVAALLASLVAAAALGAVPRHRVGFRSAPAGSSPPADVVTLSVRPPTAPTTPSADPLVVGPDPVTITLPTPAPSEPASSSSARPPQPPAGTKKRIRAADRVDTTRVVPPSSAPAGPPSVSAADGPAPAGAVDPLSRRK